MELPLFDFKEYFGMSITIITILSDWICPEFQKINMLSSGILLVFSQRIAMNSLKKRIESIEKEEIIKALKESKWVKAKAARRLGVTERIIGYKIKKYYIRQEKEKEAL